MRIKKNESINDFIKRLRKKMSLTQTEFGLLIGYHPATVCAWEKGRAVPRYTEMTILAFAKGIK